MTAAVQERLQFPEKVARWRAPAVLPSLAGVDRVYLDVEATGKHKHHDMPVGAAVRTPDGRSWYLPWAHRGGGNLDEDACRRWARAELAGKEVVNLNTGFDAELLRRWGVDLEALSCTLRDVGHAAALLDEHRYSGFSLDALGEEYAGIKKLELPFPAGDIWKRPAAEIAPYALRDVDVVAAVDAAQLPQVEEQELGRVYKLESDLVWVVNHMEREASRIDLKKLRRWQEETRDELSRNLLELYRTAGRKVNPDSPADMAALFAARGIRVPVDDLTGKETFDKAHLSAISDPAVLAVVACRQLTSIRSKYLLKWPKHLDGELLRYTLHQLRSDEYGTITGRFSSANINAQQVMKVEKQLKEMAMLARWVLRELFVPAEGLRYLAADASQIEFRLFAHYSGSLRLINEYRENPNVDFHEQVAQMIGQPRYQAKHNNFGKVYGMGLFKLCVRLGKPCLCGHDRKNFWKVEEHAEDCPAREGIAINERYDERFPEARALLSRAATIAERRGYVRTLLGRRGRFDDRRATGYHAALNKVIQGSAADVNKMKLLQLYRNMKSVGLERMRLTVHDEVTGDVLPDPKYKQMVKELLEEGLGLGIRVPIVWDVKTGKNWRECT